MYLYPENLTARPMLWLWTLRDVAWIGTGLLLSVLALTQTGSMIPLVITAALAFLCIRHGGISMLDFLRYAAAFFFFGQSFNRFLIISLDVLICRYSPLFRAFPAHFISEEPHKSFYYPSCFRSQK